MVYFLRFDEGLSSSEGSEDSKAALFGYLSSIGLLHYHHMPFELTSIPSTFQRIMSKLIVLNGALCLCAITKTEEHIAHVKECCITWIKVKSQPM